MHKAHCCNCAHVPESRDPCWQPKSRQQSVDEVSLIGLTLDKSGQTDFAREDHVYSRASPPTLKLAQNAPLRSSILHRDKLYGNAAMP